MLAGQAFARRKEPVQSDSSKEWAKLGTEIHVWHAALDRDERDLARLQATLSADEKARADRFRFAKDKNHYTVARGLLRELLGNYLQKPPASMEFTYGPHGKPALAGKNASSGISFNLSHSFGLAVYAFSKGRDLGIDVEHVQPESAGEDIARRFFSPREVGDLRSLPPEARTEAFFLCWTRKEAYIKALGTGLHTPLDSFSVSLRPGQPAEFLEGAGPRWHIAAFEPAEGYAAAVVYDGAPVSVKFMGTI
jgi:4'-phosphopantetheinyl transferase